MQITITIGDQLLHRHSRRHPRGSTTSLARLPVTDRHGRPRRCGEDRPATRGHCPSTVSPRAQTPTSATWATTRRATTSSSTTATSPTTPASWRWGRLDGDAAERIAALSGDPVARHGRGSGDQTNHGPGRVPPSRRQWCAHRRRLGAHRFMHDAAQDAFQITAELNRIPHPDEVRALLGELTGRAVDESVTVFPPFYSEFGKNLTPGQGRVHQPRVPLPGHRGHHHRRRHPHRPRQHPDHPQPQRRPRPTSRHAPGADRHRTQGVARRVRDRGSGRHHR